ncbi:uncharacterized protein DS421_6g178720 [Arachis hypogaea]|nr:uncharacterized protein DS421_6g178720 [Arachis hypogaea]
MSNSKVYISFVLLSVLVSSEALNCVLLEAPPSKPFPGPNIVEPPPPPPPPSQHSKHMVGGG